MNPAPFVPSALAMTRRLKRRDRCPARLALRCLEVAHTDGKPAFAYTSAVRGKPEWLTYSQIDADDSRQLSRKRARYSNSLTRPGNSSRLPLSSNLGEK